MILPRFITIFFQSVLYWITFILFKTFCKFEVKGLENVMNLPPGIIFAANHTSEWDGILVRVALPFFSSKFSPMYYVSRSADFYVDSGWRQIFYGGLIFRMLGAYPAYSGKNDYGYSLQHFVKILGLKRNVCIFPEGRRSTDGSLGEAHGGVVYLANATNAPIVPVAIMGLFNISVNNFLMFKHQVQLNFGAPFYPEYPGPVSVKEIKVQASIVMQKIATLLHMDQALYE